MIFTSLRMCKRMRIELYVCTTENPDEELLKTVMLDLIREFNGLTVIPCVGYWLNEKKELFEDRTEIWQIFTENGNFDDLRLLIESYSFKLKCICNQQTQMYALNDKAYFI
jgi:hypothetical protein